MLRYNRPSLVALAFALCATSTFAQAQDATSTPDTPRATSDEMDIVVTARRRAERLQDVPVAITAISSESLQKANITSVQDIQQKVPGMTITSSAFGSNILQPAIRGQRQFDAYISKDPAVSVYFADVVQNRAQGLNSALYDLENIQVLKGPQGTLFGRNSTGGALIITPKSPSENLEGYFIAGYGNYNARRAEGAINLPIADWLQVRFAGAVGFRRGFTNNVTTGQHLDNQNQKNWRISARLTPFDGFENRFVISGFSADENAVGYKLTGLVPGSLAATRFPGLAAELAAYASLPYHTTTSNVTDPTKIHTLAISNISELQVGSATIRNIFGYRYVSSKVPFDLDGSSFTVFPSREDMTDRQYSNELQLLGKAFDNSLDYIVGAYYFREKGSDQQTSGGLGGTAAGDRVTLADPIINTAYSVFAQVTYKLPFLEGVSLTGGARQNHDKRELTSRNKTPSGVCRLVNASNVPLNPCIRYNEKSYNKITYTVSADWKVTPDVLLYVAHRRGYRTGGFNISATTAPQFKPFEPEEVNDFEIGLKSDFHLSDMRGRFNLAAYTQDYKNIQRNQGAIIDGVFVQTIVNAAAATIKGFEADLSLKPTDNIDLGGSLSHIDGKYRNWTDASGNDLTQNQFAGAPKWSVGANAEVRMPLQGDAGTLALRADYFYQTRTVASDTSYNPATKMISPFAYLDAYTLVNGRFEWRDIFGKDMTAGVWVKNLFDKEYRAGGTDLTPTVGIVGNFLGAPRTFGFDVAYHF